MELFTLQIHILKSPDYFHDVEELLELEELL